MDFYYPNFINDHWRIQGQIFFGDKNHFVDLKNKRFKIDEIVAFCQEKGLAFFDTSTAVRRLQDNASDKFLQVVEPTDIRALIAQLPHLRAIITTGEKATETICTYFGIHEIPKVNSQCSIFKAAIEREKSDACINSSEREQARRAASIFKAAIEREKNDACISSSEREQARSAASMFNAEGVASGMRERSGNGQCSMVNGQLTLYRLPSSSRAYPLSFDKKVEAYRNCLNSFLV
jgi:G:T/U-mismatch repair DNA glycosylase